MGNASMHKWKMPLKYWGMVPTLSGPLGLGRAADTMVGGVYLTKRGRNIMHSYLWCTSDHFASKVDKLVLNSLTPMGARERPPFNELLCSLVTSPIFVRC